MQKNKLKKLCDSTVHRKYRHKETLLLTDRLLQSFVITQFSVSKLNFIPLLHTSESQCFNAFNARYAGISKGTLALLQSLGLLWQGCGWKKTSLYWCLSKIRLESTTFQAKLLNQLVFWWTHVPTRIHFSVTSFGYKDMWVIITYKIRPVISQQQYITQSILILIQCIT